MRALTSSTRGLAAVVAMMAVCAFVCFRLDPPALPLGIIWNAIEARVGRSARAYVVSAWLAYWIIPLLSILVVRSSTKSRSAWVGIGAIGACLVAWLVLRRVAPGAIGYIAIWPDDHWQSLRQSWFERRPLRDCPPLPFTCGTFYYQKADFLSLLAFAFLFLIKHYRVLPRRSLAIGALAVNVWKCVEWCCLVWNVHHSGTGDGPRVGHSECAFALVPEWDALPRMCCTELTEGAIISITVSYLAWLVLASPRPTGASPAICEDAKC
jgi:hypothetical protein